LREVNDRGAGIPTGVGQLWHLTLLETGSDPLLIDAELGKRETLSRLAGLESTVEHIDGILINPESQPIIATGLPQMLVLWKAPLYVNGAYPGSRKRHLPQTLCNRGLARRSGLSRAIISSVGISKCHAFPRFRPSFRPIGFHVPFEWRQRCYRHRPRLHARARQGTSTPRPDCWYWSPSRSRDAQGGPYPGL